jgi:hypothetical protein
MAKKLTLFLGVLSIFSLNADEGPVCHHCEEIRLYNAKHHHNYEYYEDYLKSEGAANKTADVQPVKKNNPLPTENTAVTERLPPQ